MIWTGLFGGLRTSCSVQNQRLLMLHGCFSWCMSLHVCLNALLCNILQWQTIYIVWIKHILPHKFMQHYLYMYFISEFASPLNHHYNIQKTVKRASKHFYCVSAYSIFRTLHNFPYIHNYYISSYVFFMLFINNNNNIFFADILELNFLRCQHVHVTVMPVHKRQKLICLAAKFWLDSCLSCQSCLRSNTLISFISLWIKFVNARNQKANQLGYLW